MVIIYRYKIILITYLFSVIYTFVFLIISCTKIKREPKVETGAVSDITTTSAIAAGNIIDLGEGITDHGHCWSAASNSPTISDSKTALASAASTGSYTSELQNLQSGTNYYVRAYAKSGDGVVYGNELSFTTTAVILAALTTTPVSAVTQATAMSGGNITSDGGGTVTARGVCWATTVNPTTSGNLTSDGTGTGSFMSNITGLSPNTTYHVRAYATNSAGTAYGNDLTFTTDPGPPAVTTGTTTATSSTTATSGGNVTSDGGSAITARGVCWSTSQNPTVALSTKTTNGTGTGSFTTVITGLSPNTTYYLRAYATNSAGTAYGNQISIITDPVNITDLDGNVYDLVRIGTQLWMKENLRTTKFSDNTIIPYMSDDSQWFSLVTPGYCWFLNDETTYMNLLGALYNWHVVNTGKLCPSGWHVPSDIEWIELTNYLIANGYGFEGSGDDIAKSLSSTTLWKESETPGATGFDLVSNNSSGFTALPGGYRVDEGYFGGINLSPFEYEDGTWWSSSESGDDQAWNRTLMYHTNTLWRLQNNKNWGFSVRCVKD